jgi:hypothetical protein
VSERQRLVGAEDFEVEGAVGVVVRSGVVEDGRGVYRKLADPGDALERRWLEVHKDIC